MTLCGWRVIRIQLLTKWHQLSYYVNTAIKIEVLPFCLVLSLQGNFFFFEDYCKEVSKVLTRTLLAGSAVSVRQTLSFVSRRKDWKRFSAQSPLVFPRRPNWSFDWTKANWARKQRAILTFKMPKQYGCACGRGGKIFRRLQSAVMLFSPLFSLVEPKNWCRIKLISRPSTSLPWRVLKDTVLARALSKGCHFIFQP